MNLPLKTAAALCLVLMTAAAAPADPARSGDAVRHTLELGLVKRTYRLYVPSALPSAPVPLLLAFHGGGGNGRSMERLTRFNALAQREGFIVVYPDGVGGNWNDGREAHVSRAHRDQVDDVGFVVALVQALASQYPVDPKRIYATGLSNGAIFSHFLAANRPALVAAIAPVVGGVAERFRDRFAPAEPVSVMIIQGTGDRITPYAGGGVLRGTRGRIVSTDEAVALWTRSNACTADVESGEMPDVDPEDHCTVGWRRWSGCRDGAEVVLYRQEGGGHTWAGGPQYLPRFLVGRVCRDFDASDAIWAFFKAHPKP
jgi:polyhydroxybutyrate depolymerase